MIELYDDSVRVEIAGEGLLLRKTLATRALAPGTWVSHNGCAYVIVDGCPEGELDCLFIHADSAPRRNPPPSPRDQHASVFAQAIAHGEISHPPHDPRVLATDAPRRRKISPSPRDQHPLVFPQTSAPADLSPPDTRPARARRFWRGRIRFRSSCSS